MQRWIGGALLLAMLPLACESSQDAPPRTDAAGCTNARCAAPACCGDSCTQGSCCAGAICSLQGRCIPDTCQACGAAGCDVDFTTCSAVCAKPACCDSACTGDADCCAGTHCDPGGRCTPDVCNSCGGMTPVCQVDASCAADCVAPQSCGSSCTSDAECGADSVCKQLDLGGTCVPKAFDAACAACGSAGCTLRPGCLVRCGYGTSDAGACKRCCEPCAIDGDCCAGAICDSNAASGTPHCIPAACASCAYGCSFNCPTSP